MHSRILALICAAIPLLHGCHRAEADDPAASSWAVEGDSVRFVSKAVPLGVQVGVAGASTVAAVDVAGRLTWSEEKTARIFTPFNGRVEKILVQLGQPVKKGAPLLELSSADFGQAQAEASKASADLDAARRQHRRAQDLLDAGVLAGKDFEQAESDLRHAEAESARTASRLAALGESRTRVDGRFVLRSPVDGVVVERVVNPGTEVRSDASAALFVITDPRRLSIALDLPESIAGGLASGDDVVFHTTSDPGIEGHARITSVAAFVDPLTRMVRAKGEVANDRLALRGDSFIEARVARGSGALASVPADAVILVGDRHFVFTADGPGRFRRRPVEVHQLGERDAQIASGIAAGQPVVVDGSIYLEQLLEGAKT
jgi:cobalt-zinc-cadmium efflux system membrane fusion protein